MKELIIGTGNEAKNKAFRSVFAPLGITILGNDELGISLDIQENGSTAQENARKKSLAYAQAAGRPVLSLDNDWRAAGGLYSGSRAVLPCS